MIPSNYFKVSAKLHGAENSSEYQSSPRFDRGRSFPPIAGIFPFDSSDPASIREAYESAQVMKNSVGRGATLSVWKRPAASGPWSKVWIIGDSGVWSDVGLTFGGEA